MGLLPLLETLRSPLVGFTTLGLLLYVLIAKGKLPVRGPGVLLAFVFGTVLYYGLGLAGWARPASMCRSGCRRRWCCRCRRWASSTACPPR